MSDWSFADLHLRRRDLPLSWWMPSRLQSSATAARGAAVASQMHSMLTATRAPRAGLRSPVVPPVPWLPLCLRRLVRFRAACHPHAAGPRDCPGTSCVQHAGERADGRRRADRILTLPLGPEPLRGELPLLRVRRQLLLLCLSCCSSASASSR
jgi:hypothetical protein